MIIADAVFDSKIRIGCAVYLNPVFEEEELKPSQFYFIDLQIPGG